MHPHLPGNMTQDNMTVFKLHSEGGVGEVFHHFALHLNDVIFRHLSTLTTQGRLEVGLFQQRLILMAHHVVLNLGHEIHGHHHNDQQ